MEAAGTKRKSQSYTGGLNVFVASINLITEGLTASVV